MLDPSTLPPIDMASLLTLLQDSPEDRVPNNRVGHSCLLADPDPAVPRSVTELSWPINVYACIDTN